LSAFDDFLATKPEKGSFGAAAWKSAAEIAKEIAAEEGKNPGYHRVNEEAGWIKSCNSNELRENISLLVKDWEKHNRGIFFRGSKMPDSTFGSFGFPDKGVHVAPLLGTAQGYAASVNSDTGIGRLLRFGDEREHKSLGFLSAWEMSLNEKVWRNFQYEDYLQKGKPPSTATVKDLMQGLKNIAQLDQSSFENEKTPDGYIMVSRAEKEFRELFHDHNFYESITQSGSRPNQTFLQISNGQDYKLLKINPDNPKWDQWMARIQEANLRDFYQLQPLQKSITDLNALVNRSSTNDVEQIKIAESIIKTAQEELDKAMQEPWKCQTMKEATQMADSLPWVRESLKVGSGTDGKPNYPPNIKRIVEATDNALCGKHSEAMKILMSTPQNETYAPKRGNYKLLGPQEGMTHNAANPTTGIIVGKQTPSKLLQPRC